MDEGINSKMETDGNMLPNKDLDKADLQAAQSVFKKPALASLSSSRSSGSKPSPGGAKGEEKDAPEGRKEGRSTDTDGGEERDAAKDVPVGSEKVRRAVPRSGPSAAPCKPLRYSEPAWGGRAPAAPYSLEILKNGTIVDTVALTERSYHVVGRLPVCDVCLEHPSISRFHAVIQYRSRAVEAEPGGEDPGFYIHDLGSTHGTVVNKKKIPPKTYIRLRVGHVLKFGGSTRLFILQVNAFFKKIYIYDMTRLSRSSIHSAFL